MISVAEVRLWTRRETLVRTLTLVCVVGGLLAMDPGEETLQVSDQCVCVTPYDSGRCCVYEQRLRFIQPSAGVTSMYVQRQVDCATPLLRIHRMHDTTQLIRHLQCRAE